MSGDSREHTAPARRAAVTRRRGATVLIVAVLFAAAAALYTFLGATEYSASTLVQIDATEVAQNESSDELDTQEIATQLLVMDSDVVAGRVVTALNLDISIDELQEHVAVEQVNDSRVLRLTTRWESPDGAESVANAFAEQYLAFREEQRDDRLSEIGSTGNATIRPAPVGEVLSQATASDVPSGPSPLVMITLGALLGILVGVVIVFARDSASRGRAAEAG